MATRHSEVRGVEGLRSSGCRLGMGQPLTVWPQVVFFFKVLFGWVFTRVPGFRPRPMDLLGANQRVFGSESKDPLTPGFQKIQQLPVLLNGLRTALRDDSK